MFLLLAPIMKVHAERLTTPFDIAGLETSRQGSGCRLF